MAVRQGGYTMCEVVTGRRAAEQAGPDGTAQQDGALLLHLLWVQLPQQAETAMPREVLNLLLTPSEVTEHETGSIPLCAWGVTSLGKLLLLLCSSYVSTNPRRGGERCPRKATGTWNLCVRHARGRTGADQPRLWAQAPRTICPKTKTRRKISCKGTCKPG